MLSVVELYFSSSPLDSELSWKVASCDSFSWILFTFGNHTDTGCLLCSRCVVEQFSTNTAGALSQVFGLSFKMVDCSERSAQMCEILLESEV